MENEKVVPLGLTFVAPGATFIFLQNYYEFIYLMIPVLHFGEKERIDFYHSV